MQLDNHQQLYHTFLEPYINQQHILLKRIIRNNSFANSLIFILVMGIKKARKKAFFDSYSIQE